MIKINVVTKEFKMESKIRPIDITQQKLLALEILKSLYSFCKENNLKMYLAYGTLLGAVRHKGYIPWDDDIDVLMPRKDYEILLKSYVGPEYYRLYHNGNSSTYNKAFATLNDIRTYKEEYMIREKYRDDLCVNVDIFPFDNMPDVENEQRKFFDRILNKAKILQCLVWKYSKGSTFFKTLQKNIGITIMRLGEALGIISLRKMLDNTTKLLTKYNTQDTMYVACGANPLINQMKEIMPSDIFAGERYLEFEGVEFPVPYKYDEFLRRIYGSYMQLPPVEKRRPHHLSKCYWRKGS